VGKERFRAGDLAEITLRFSGNSPAMDFRAPEIAVPDAHSLMRAIETLDLMDNGEIVMHAAIERKESRAMHLRSDYTFTNPLLADKFLEVWQEDGVVRKEWRQRWN